MSKSDGVYEGKNVILIMPKGAMKSRGVFTRSSRRNWFSCRLLPNLDLPDHGRELVSINMNTSEERCQSYKHFEILE